MGWWEKVIRDYHTMELSWGEVIQTILHERNTGWAQSSLGTDNHSPYGEKSWDLRVWSHNSPNALVPAYCWLYQAYSWLREGPMFVPSIQHDLRKKILRLRPQAITGSAKHVLGFKQGTAFTLHTWVPVRNPNMSEVESHLTCMARNWPQA